MRREGVVAEDDLGVFRGFGISTHPHATRHAHHTHNHRHQSMHAHTHAHSLTLREWGDLLRRHFCVTRLVPHNCTPPPACAAPVSQPLALCKRRFFKPPAGDAAGGCAGHGKCRQATIGKVSVCGALYMEASRMCANPPLRMTESEAKQA